MLSQSLLNLLPVLALIGLGMNGAEVSAAHTHPARAHHRHLAERNKLASNLGAKAKKRGQVSVIRRGADGKACRVRGESSTAPSLAQPTSAEVVVTSVAVSVAPSTTEVAVTYVESSAAPQEPTPQHDQNWAQPSASPAPAPTPEAPAQDTTPYTPINNAGGKKLGLAWPNGDWAQPNDPNYIGNYIGDKAGWLYTWSPFPVGSANKVGLEFVPMLWGPHQVSDWWAQQANWPASTKNALFFNEPNEHSQCNVAASDAISFWMNDYLPVRSRGIALGSAATTSAPSGLQWNKDFIASCIGAGNSRADCTPDFTALHWYDMTADNLIKYIEKFHNELNSDIWVTEYALHNFNGGAQGNADQVWQFHQTMIEWFDRTDYVKRYSPFGVMQNMQGVNQLNALMDPSGHATALNNMYIW